PRSSALRDLVGGSAACQVTQHVANGDDSVGRYGRCMRRWLAVIAAFAVASCGMSSRPDLPAAAPASTTTTLVVPMTTSVPPTTTSTPAAAQAPAPAPGPAPAPAPAHPDESASLQAVVNGFVAGRSPGYGIVVVDLRT